MLNLTPEEKLARRRAQMASNPALRARNYARKKAWVKSNPKKWAELERQRHLREPFLKLIMKSRIRAKASSIANDLTVEWARSRWTGRCELTGAEFLKTYNGKQNSFSPSLDRIDPSIGYLQTNCRFILCALNRFKGDQTDETMLRIAMMLIGSINAQAT